MTTLQDKLLCLLFEHQNVYLSGQKLCDQLGCSRTAVWKHIKELEQKGYTIESLHKKGYRLLKAPETLSVGEILSGLSTKKLGQVIDYHESISSTQKLAHHMAEDGAVEGTLVIADEQVSGRGRLGRTWHSPKGTGISMSLILRPNVPLQATPQITLLAAVAVVKGVLKTTGMELQIKWPNDVLYDGKKLVGILTELQAEADRVKAVIVGMGMNVNIPKEEFPEDIAKIATSLQVITGKIQRRSQIVQAILNEFEKLYFLYLDEGFSIIKLLWESYSISVGTFIKARTMSGSTLSGFAKGINDEGVLLLEDSTGQIHHIYSADIELTSPKS